VDADSLRAALLRRLAGASSAAGCAVATRGVAGVREEAQRRTEALPVTRAAAPASRPAAASRPDMSGFVQTVLGIAQRHAEGWPGNRKALVSKVFAAVAETYPGWGLTLVEFKAMLAECHRLGRLSLVTADLKSKGQLEALKASAISYKNTVWHLIRVEDPAGA
jgi:hypothetical protein